jgi:hypothetical protein
MYHHLLFLLAEAFIQKGLTLFVVEFFIIMLRT